PTRPRDRSETSPTRPRDRSETSPTRPRDRSETYYKTGNQRLMQPNSRPTGGFRADYSFVGTLDAEIRREPDREIEEIPMTDVAELSQRMTNFVTSIRQDTDEIYGRLNDARDGRLLISS
nr:hypothetical protein [Tanacetum cinerariifolium]